MAFPAGYGLIRYAAGRSVHTRGVALALCVACLSCASPAVDLPYGADCELSVEQEQPIRVVFFACLSENFDGRMVESRYYSFEDAEFNLVSASESDSPTRAEIYADRDRYENRGLTAEEIASPLLKMMIEFLRDRGISDIELITPDMILEPDFYYDSLPPSPRPAA